MRRVPADDRSYQEGGEQPAGPQLPGAPPAARLRHEDEVEHDAGAEKQHRILGVEPEAGEQADRQPPPGGLARRQLRQRPDGKTPEQHRRRIGRCQQAADADQQAGIEKEHRKAGDAGAVEQLTGAPQRGRADGGRQHRHAPQAERGVAEQRLPEEGEPGDHRRMVVIAGGGRKTPEPVIGLVFGKAGIGGDQQPQHSQGGDQQHEGQGAQP